MCNHTKVYKKVVKTSTWEINRVEVAGENSDHMTFILQGYKYYVLL